MISKRKENSSPKMFEKLIDNKYFPKKEIYFLILTTIKISRKVVAKRTSTWSLMIDTSNKSPSKFYIMI